jgi:hypothetical protein
MAYLLIISQEKERSAVIEADVKMVNGRRAVLKKRLKVKKNTVKTKILDVLSRIQIRPFSHPGSKHFFIPDPT